VVDRPNADTRCIWRSYRRSFTGVNGIRTAAVSALTVVGYPLVGVLALVEANRHEAGWTSSNGLMPLVLLLFVVPVVLTAITTLLSGVHWRTSLLLALGTVVASFVALLVLIAIASADGALS
jgi:hypothetical protein